MEEEREGGGVQMGTESVEEERARRGGLGKSLAQLQAEAMAERRVTDFLASAGVGLHQVAQEMLFFLPRGFVDSYEEMFVRAFGGKDDGGSNSRGQAAAEAGRVMRSKAGSKEGPQARGGGKRYKKHWIIADERAVDLKERIDKRLRGIAREIQEELAGGGRAREGDGRTRCEECGRILQASWDYCPFDGYRVAR